MLGGLGAQGDEEEDGGEAVQHLAGLQLSLNTGSQIVSIKYISGPRRTFYHTVGLGSATPTTYLNIVLLLVTTCTFYAKQMIYCN